MINCSTTPHTVATDHESPTLPCNTIALGLWSYDNCSTTPRILATDHESPTLPCNTMALGLWSYDNCSTTPRILETDHESPTLPCKTIVLGLGLWCFMPLSTIFQLYHAWWSVLLVKETEIEVLGENHQPVARCWRTLSHNVALSTPHHEQGSNSQL